MNPVLTPEERREVLSRIQWRELIDLICAAAAGETRMSPERARAIRTLLQAAIR